MRLKVDRDLCISAASCVALLPEVFELDDEGKALIKNLAGSKTSDWTDLKQLPADIQAIMEAARSCPTDAIIIEDDNGQQIYP
ncbi:ferredoxin [Patescibacteria group bacterium]|nr:ferredoxin [Patescibacteria group bacterium]